MTLFGCNIHTLVLADERGPSIGTVEITLPDRPTPLRLDVQVPWSKVDSVIADLTRAKAEHHD